LEVWSDTRATRSICKGHSDPWKGRHVKNHRITPSQARESHCFCISNAMVDLTCKCDAPGGTSARRVSGPCRKSASLVNISKTITGLDNFVALGELLFGSGRLSRESLAELRDVIFGLVIRGPWPDQRHKRRGCPRYLTLQGCSSNLHNRSSESLNF
jgi:hypothetical protein